MILNDKALEEFIKHLVAEEKSKNTIDKYQRDITKLIDFLRGKKGIGKEDIIKFKESLLHQYKASSINSILVAVNQFLQFHGYSDIKVKLLKSQRRIICEESKELTRKEYERLLVCSSSNKRLHLLLQTICSTGIRVSEHKFITVEQLKKGRILITNKGKTRVVFIQKKLSVRLLAYCRNLGIVKGSIFITKQGNPLNRSNIWRMMKKLCEEAEVASSKVFPHNLRHLFALTYYRLQKDIVRLADLLGHSSIETTRIYTLTTGHEYEKELSKMKLLGT